jgi:beta-mannosidase
MALQRLPISTGWSFKNAESSDDTFLPVSQFPTTIHQDLLHHGKIVDPFLDSNESRVQWVGEEAWTYRTTFSKPQVEFKDMSFELVIEGLDTHCTVLLNSKEIKRTDNMHLEHRINISDLIEEVNELELRFESTFLVGRRMEKETKIKP